MLVGKGETVPRVAVLVPAALLAGTLLLWLAGTVWNGGGRGGGALAAGLPGALFVVDKWPQAARAVRCSTSKGDLTVRLAPELAPNGTKFLVDITRAGYWSQPPPHSIPFWRVNDAITQFGIAKRHARVNDPFLKWREGAERDVNPFGGAGDDPRSVELRKAHPWPRGTMASIGGFHFVVVKRANNRMGVNRHDAPLGFIAEEDMAAVVDRLYQYGDPIDNKHGPAGPDQTRVSEDGDEYITREVRGARAQSRERGGGWAHGVEGVQHADIDRTVPAYGPYHCLRARAVNRDYYWAI